MFGSRRREISTMKLSKAGMGHNASMKLAFWYVNVIRFMITKYLGLSLKNEQLKFS